MKQVRLRFDFVCNCICISIIVFYKKIRWKYLVDVSFKDIIYYEKKYNRYK